MPLPVKRFNKSRSNVVLTNVGLIVPSKKGFAATSGNDESNGIIVKRFRKDMISVGVYTHPVHGWSMDATPDRIDRWVAAFQSMSKNGIDVEINVDHNLQADAVLGYVVDMFREGDNLIGIFEFIGQKSIDLASVVKNVSIGVDRDYQDGKGIAYGEAITHCAVVQQPIASGQESFQPIEASRLETNRRPVLVFGLQKIEKEQIMTGIGKEVLDKLKELLGAGDDFTEENALSRIEERLTSLSAERDTLNTENINLKGEVDTLKIVNAGKKEPDTEIPPDLAEQMAVTGEQQLSMLVETGKITPAVRDKLAGSLVGATGKRSIMTMSLKGGNGKQSILTAVVDALKDNDVVKLGEQTGAQTLSRQDATNSTTEKSYDPDLTKEMIEMANGPKQ